jgi:hypothetical protein
VQLCARTIQKKVKEGEIRVSQAQRGTYQIATSPIFAVERQRTSIVTEAARTAREESHLWRAGAGF